MGDESAANQHGDDVVELNLFGPMTLSRFGGGEESGRPRDQLQLLVGMVVAEGDQRLQIADDRLANYLWGQTVDADPNSWELKKLTRLFHELNTWFKGTDGKSRGHVERDSGLTRLVNLVVDVREFELACASSDWVRAIELAERGRVLEGVRVRSGATNAREWLNRVRHRFKVKIDHCFHQRAHELVTDADRIDEVIDICTRHQRFAESEGLETRVRDLEGELERLHALRDKRSPDTAMPPTEPLSDAGPRPEPLDRKLASRLGSALSLYVDPAHRDAHHRYEVLFRQDLLDYASGDFYSIRRLQGVCVDKAPSAGLLYVESSEQKIPFRQTGIVAYDTQTRDRLLVEPLLSDEEYLFQHAFRIYFAKPLCHGEEFDLVYAMRLPGELKVLSPKSEIMSIALVRLDHGVRDLTFNVCMNFKPRAVMAEALVEAGKPTPIEPTPTVGPYVPENWFERDLDISWSTDPYRMSWGIRDPKAPLYILRYSV